MAKIQFIKKQIELIQQIRHVTRTMKTISAVRWRMGRRTLEESRLFAEQILRLNEIVHLYHPSPLPRPHPSRGFAVVGIFSDKGLVGGFNSVLASKISQFIEIQKHEGNKAHVIVLGSQGISLMKRKPYEILLTHPLPVHQIPHYQDIRDFVYSLLHFHREGYFSHLYIIFNRYLSVSEYRSTIRRVLPVPIQGIYLPTEKREELQEQYDLLSNCSSLIDRLTFEYIASQFYRGITESFISEQATRLTIMDAATTHSDEMINSLRITYQKKRQERITQELNEVTSAFQVLGKA